MSEIEEIDHKRDRIKLEIKELHKELKESKKKYLDKIKQKELELQQLTESMVH